VEGKIGKWRNDLSLGKILDGAIRDLANLEKVEYPWTCSIFKFTLMHEYRNGSFSGPQSCAKSAELNR
jgi:hypothetical protein